MLLYRRPPIVSYRPSTWREFIQQNESPRFADPQELLGVRPSDDISGAHAAIMNNESAMQSRVSSSSIHPQK